MISTRKLNLNIQSTYMNWKRWRLTIAYPIMLCAVTDNLKPNPGEMTANLFTYQEFDFIMEDLLFMAECQGKCVSFRAFPDQKYTVCSTYFLNETCCSLE